MESNSTIEVRDQDFRVVAHLVPGDPVPREGELFTTFRRTYRVTGVHHQYSNATHKRTLVLVEPTVAPGE